MIPMKNIKLCVGDNNEIIWGMWLFTPSMDQRSMYNLSNEQVIPPCMNLTFIAHSRHYVSAMTVIVDLSINSVWAYFGKIEKVLIRKGYKFAVSQEKKTEANSFHTDSVFCYENVHVPVYLNIFIFFYIIKLMNEA